jgi:nitrogen fixation protein NifX
MKIAFTTRDRIHVNSHFGSASAIDVYELSPNGYTFLETIRFDGNLNEDGNEDKLQPKIEALHDCTLVYTATIGASAASRLIKHHITPVNLRSEDETVGDMLTKLIEMLKGSPPPWLRKALQQRNTSFLDELKAEEEEVTV